MKNTQIFRAVRKPFLQLLRYRGNPVRLAYPAPRVTSSMSHSRQANTQKLTNTCL